MISVEIPATIRAAVQCPAQIPVEGLSVKEALESLCIQYPSMRPRLLADDGALHRFVNIYLDGVDVREIEGVSSTLIGIERMQILSAISGG